MDPDVFRQGGLDDCHRAEIVFAGGHPRLPLRPDEDLVQVQLVLADGLQVFEVRLRVQALLFACFQQAVPLFGGGLADAFQVISARLKLLFVLAGFGQLLLQRLLLLLGFLLHHGLLRRRDLQKTISYIILCSRVNVHIRLLFSAAAARLPESGVELLRRSCYNVNVKNRPS